MLKHQSSQSLRNPRSTIDSDTDHWSDSESDHDCTMRSEDSYNSDNELIAAAPGDRASPLWSAQLYHANTLMSYETVSLESVQPQRQGASYISSHRWQVEMSSQLTRLYITEGVPEAKLKVKCRKQRLVNERRSMGREREAETSMAPICRRWD